MCNVHISRIVFDSNGHILRTVLDTEQPRTRLRASTAGKQFLDGDVEQ